MQQIVDGYLCIAVAQKIGETEKYLCKSNAIEMLNIADNFEYLANVIWNKYDEWEANGFVVKEPEKK